MARPIVVAFLGDTAGLDAAFAKVEAATNKVSSSGGPLSKLASVGKAAFAGLAGGAAAVATASIKLADEYEASHARLVTSLTNAGTSWNAQKKAIDAVEASSEKLGFTHTQVEEALAVLVRGTGNAQKAVGFLGVAQDLAAAKGMSLADAATIVTRASEGQLRPLKQLGLDLPIAAGGALKSKQAMEALAKAQDNLRVVEQKIHDGRLKGPAAATALAKANDALRAAQEKLNEKTSTGDQIIAALGQKLDGSASRQAETFGGKVKALKAHVEDWGIAIGMKLIPVIEKLASFVADASKWLSKHREILYPLVALVGVALVAAFAAWTASLFAAGGALAFLMSPITLVVVAVAGIAIGVMELWNHWDEVWNWISNHKAYAALIAAVFPILIPIFAIVAAAKFLYENWDAVWSGIVDVAQKVWSIIGPVVQAGMAVIQAIITFVSDVIDGKWSKLWGDVLNIVSSVWGYITAVVQGAVNGLIAWWSLILGGISAAWSGIWSGLGGIFTNVWEGVKGAVKGGINGIIDLVNSGIHFLNSIKIKVGIDDPTGLTGGVHWTWNGLQLPDIPKLAAGGVFSSPVLAMIGEASSATNREIATPERLLREVVREETIHAPSAAAPKIGSVTINAQTNADADQIAHEISWLAKCAGF